MNENQNQNGSRITITQARKALGMIARNYSDEQISEILSTMREAAEYTYDKYMERDDQ